MSDVTDLAGYLDATLLDGTVPAAQVREFALDAQQAGCAAVCVHAAHLSAIVDIEIPVAVVVSFPHGADTPGAKAAATTDALTAGAAEIDVVMRLDALLDGDRTTALDDLKGVVDAAGGRTVKAIMETGVLTDAAFKLACEVITESGAAFAKTSTGRGPRGASVEDVRKMRELLPASVAIKAAGGIRTREFAQELIEAGATRLGVSSWRAVINDDQSAPTSAY